VTPKRAKSIDWTGIADAHDTDLIAKTLLLCQKISKYAFPSLGIIIVVDVNNRQA